MPVSSTSDGRVSNALGVPLPQWIIKQLEKRSLELSAPQKDIPTNDNVLYRGNRSSWVRLISSVDLVEPIKTSTKPPSWLDNYISTLYTVYDESLDKNKTNNKATRYFQELGVDIKKPSDLAKKFVLQGGVSKYTKTSDKTFSYTPLGGLSESYNVAGEKEIREYGYRPMPGITSVKVQTQGRLGSIRSAEIQLRVWDKTQLDIIDALYFKLGYSLFLEWGHTTYYKAGSDELMWGEDFSIDAFSDNNSTKEDIQNKISANSRNSEGNYDAMLGIVTNFNFTYNQEGGYDCSIKLMSLGVLISSTKMNNPRVLPDLQDSIVKKLFNLLINLEKQKLLNDQNKSEDQQKDQQKQIDLKEKSILAFLNTEIYKEKIKQNPNLAIPGIGGGYPDEVGKSNIIAIAGILNSSFDKTNAKVEDYDFIRDLSGNLGYTLFSQKYGLEIPSNDTSTFISSITLDRYKLVQKLKSLYYGPNISFTLNPQNQTDFVDSNVPNSLPLEKLISLDSDQRVNIAGLKSDTIWKTYDLSYVGKNNKRYIIKIEVDLPSIEYNSPNPDPNARGLTPVGTAAKKNQIYYPYNQKALFDETIDFILNSQDFNPIFEVKNTKVFVGLTKDVLNDINIRGLVDLKTKVSIPETDINSTNVEKGNPGETYAFSLKGKYVFRAKQFTSTSTNTQLGTVTTEQIAELDSKEPVEYTIYISDLDLISDLKPGTDESLLFSDYFTKLAAQNQQNIASEGKSDSTLSVSDIQKSEALKYRSAFEVMVRTIQLYSLNEAIESKGIETDRRPKKLNLLQDSHYNSFTKKLFSNGLFTPVMDKLQQFSKSKDKTYFKKIDFSQYDEYAKSGNSKDEIQNLLVRALFGFNFGLMGNKLDSVGIAEELYNKDLLVDYNNLFTTCTIPYQFNTGVFEGTQVNHPVYVSFGLVLMILNHACLIYDSTDKNSDKKSTTPMFYIDFNNKTNLCLTSPKQISTNPYDVIIPIQASDSDFASIIEPTVLTSKNKIKAPKQGEQKETPVFSPEKDDLLSYALPEFRDTQSVIDNYRGRTMNILISCDYLLKVVDSYSKANNSGDVYVKEFIEQILFDVNKSLGDFNIFRLAYDDGANTAHVVDDQLSPNLEGKYISSENRSKLPLFGRVSIAKSIEIRTEISSKLSNMLAVSANAQIENTSNLSKTADSYGFYNSSYKDRYIPNRTEITSDSLPTDTMVNSAIQFNNAISTFYGNATPAIDSVGHATNYYIQRMSRLKSEDKGTRSSVMIPVSLNFSMDGISGVGMGHAFTIPEEFLPYTYNLSLTDPYGNQDQINTVGFVTVGLDQTIENNQWTSNFRCNMMYLKKMDDFSAKDMLKKLKENPNSFIAAIESTFTDSYIPDSVQDCKRLKGILNENIVESKIVNSNYGTPIKGKSSFIISVEKAYNSLKASGITLSIGDSYRSFQFQRSAYEEYLKNVQLQKQGKEWVKNGQRNSPSKVPDNVAHPCSGYHVQGQAIDLEQTADQEKDILAQGPIYKALYDQGLRRISNEWWHWSLGEVS